MKNFLVISLFSLFSSALSAQQPTWSEQIACISFSRCTPCHHPGGPAPFSMMTYADVFPARFAIRNAVQTKFMPPWPPDPTYARHAFERALTQSEIDEIVLWVNQGAPEGNPANLPSPPAYNNASQLTQVSWTGRMPEYTNTISGEDYRCFLIPVNNATPQTITAVEVVPGNRSMVHHVLVYQDNSSTPAQLDAADPLPGYSNFGGVGSPNAKLIGAWVPGSSPMVFPAGTGIPIPANGQIVIQVHYPVGTLNKTDSTRINLTFGSGGLREIALDPALNHYTNLNEPLAIPPGQIKSFYAERTIPVPVTLLSVAPHMHLLGKSIKVFAVKPNNDTVPLIHIPKWDFAWQGSYDLKRAVTFPAGTKIRAEAVYDNTSANPWNPSNPPQWVYAGEATTDEMMVVYFSYLIPSFAADTNIVIDPHDTQPTWMGCEFLGESTFSPVASIQVYPQPARSEVHLTGWPAYFTSDILVYQMLGKKVWEGRLEADETGKATLSFPGLASGKYVVWLAKTGQRIPVMLVE